MHKSKRVKAPDVPEIYVDLMNWVQRWYFASVTTVPFITGFSKEVDDAMTKLIHSPMKEKAHRAWSDACADDLYRIHRKYQKRYRR